MIRLNFMIFISKSSDVIRKLTPEISFHNDVFTPKATHSNLAAPNIDTPRHSQLQLRSQSEPKRVQSRGSADQGWDRQADLLFQLSKTRNEQSRSSSNIVSHAVKRRNRVDLKYSVRLRRGRKLSCHEVNKFTFTFNFHN